MSDRRPTRDELVAALQPFAKVAALFKDRKPQNGDVIMAWELTSGTAEIRVSDCERAAAILERLLP